MNDGVDPIRQPSYTNERVKEYFPDNSSSNGDNRAPSALLSTPPSSVHDTSRAGFHNEDFQSFVNIANSAAERAFPNNEKLYSRYIEVHVLLLRWEKDRLGVQRELESLTSVFQSYGFKTDIYLIPSVDSQLELTSKAIEFIRCHRNENNLLIVYYGGHGAINRARQTTWSCERTPNNGSLEWSAIQRLFEDTPTDVLLLLDCCAAASAAPFTGHGVTETIAACGFETWTPGPGSDSFTHTLIEALKHLRNLCFSAAMLHARILYDLKQYSCDSTVGGQREHRRSPIHHFMTTDPNARSVDLTRIQAARSKPAKSIVQIDDEGNVFFDAEDSGLSTNLSEDTSQLSSPYVLISVAVEEEQNLNPNLFIDWISRMPFLARNVRIEAVFRSYSTLLLVSIPVVIWNLLPEDQAWSFVGYVQSANLLSNPLESLHEMHDISKSQSGDSGYYERPGNIFERKSSAQNIHANKMLSDPESSVPVATRRSAKRLRTSRRRGNNTMVTGIAESPRIAEPPRPSLNQPGKGKVLFWDCCECGQSEMRASTNGYDMCHHCNHQRDSTCKTYVGVKK